MIHQPLYGHIRSLANKGRKVDLMEAMRTLRVLINQGKLFEYVERSDSEPAKSVVRRMKLLIEEAFGYEDFGNYQGQLPWNPAI